ncbi:MAG: LysM peptidoglycan-binding domain-containing protein [Mycobacterium sp.]
MTITAYPQHRVPRAPRAPRAPRRTSRPQRYPAASRPASARPAGVPLRYGRFAVAVSTVPHRRKPVSVAMTAALAVAAALITVWLGSIARAGGVTGADAAVPDRLAVVQVASGESLEQLASRVAPAAQAPLVIDRIRELNDLGDSDPVPGQTLIAPVG